MNNQMPWYVDSIRNENARMNLIDVWSLNRIFTATTRFWSVFFRLCIEKEFVQSKSSFNVSDVCAKDVERCRERQSQNSKVFAVVNTIVCWHFADTHSNDIGVCAKKIYARRHPFRSWIGTFLGNVRDGFYCIPEAFLSVAWVGTHLFFHQSH